MLLPAVVLLRLQATKLARCSLSQTSSWNSSKSQQKCDTRHHAPSACAMPPGGQPIASSIGQPQRKELCRFSFAYDQNINRLTLSGHTRQKFAQRLALHSIDLLGHRSLKRPGRDLPTKNTTDSSVQHAYSLKWGHNSGTAAATICPKRSPHSILGQLPIMPDT